MKYRVNRWFVAFFAASFLLSVVFIFEAARHEVLVPFGADVPWYLLGINIVSMVCLFIACIISRVQGIIVKEAVVG